MSSGKPPIFFLEYIFFRALAFFINLFSLRQAAKLAAGVGSLLFCIMRKKKAVMMDNLRQAFGHEKSEEELRQIAHLSMQSMVRVAFEFIRIPKVLRTKEIQWRVEGAHWVWEALEKKKGLIAIVSHFGNWELMGLAAALEGFPIHAIARPIKNEYVYNYIKRIRGQAGFPSIDKNGAAREVIKQLKRNQMIAMLIDQRERQGGVQVDFFGRKAMTSSLPAVLALKYGTPVIPSFFLRETEDAFVLYLGEPYTLIRTGNDEADVIANTQKYIACIEQEIRKRPGDWLWMHRRWRL